MYRRASEIWTALDNKRTGMLTRIERYAALTIAKVCYPDNFDSDNTDDSHDYQSIGAQAVNHLCNKLMLAMFAPSRPFVKLKAGKRTEQQAAKAKLTEVQLNSLFANGERKAVAELDNSGQRPKLFQVMRHIVVTGNVLLDTTGDVMRVLGLKKFVVKRNLKGEVMHLVIREAVRFDELDAKVRQLYAKQYNDEATVNFYKWIKREDSGAYTLTQWLEENILPKEYNGRWSNEENCPYRVITWDLADDSDYATGLVEEYIGDFEALSVLSESVVDGGVLGAEMRWMVNPNGITSVDDLNNSENGDALPGLPTDVAPVQGGNPKAVEIANIIGDKYEKRIARGFLMGSAVIRDAERVTTEEVRLTATELETAYGSVYSTLASSLQKPVAKWLFKRIDLDLKGTDIDVTIVTGLDALSRNGDLENFRLAMGDMAAVTAVPPELAARVKWEEVAAFVGQGRGVDLSKFILSDTEFAQKQQAAQQTAMAQQVLTTAGEAAVQQGTKNG